MCLPKNFDKINLDLLLAKLHAYGLSGALNMCNYLINRKQIAQINNFSATKTAIAGVPQGSIDI